MKAFSNFAFKGTVAAIAGIYLMLFALSFWNIHSYNNKLENYGKVAKLHILKTKEKKILSKELKLITSALQLSKSLKSNKDLTYRALSQIASSVPKRVKFDVLEYNGKDLITIQGLAASDQDILRLIDNLSKQKLIKQASLSSMKLPKKNKSQGGVQFKGFRIFVRIKG